MTPREGKARQDEDADSPVPADPPPVPDEDGPHDVPDETVIEKTLPTVPVPGGS